MNLQFIFNYKLCYRLVKLHFMWLLITSSEKLLSVSVEHFLSRYTSVPHSFSHHPYLHLIVYDMKSVFFNINVPLKKIYYAVNASSLSQYLIGNTFERKMFPLFSSLVNENSIKVRELSIV